MTVLLSDRCPVPIVVVYRGLPVFIVYKQGMNLFFSSCFVANSTCFALHSPPSNSKGINIFCSLGLRDSDLLQVGFHVQGRTRTWLSPFLVQPLNYYIIMAFYEQSMEIKGLFIRISWLRKHWAIDYSGSSHCGGFPLKTHIIITWNWVLKEPQWIQSNVSHICQEWLFLDFQKIVVYSFFLQDKGGGNIVSTALVGRGFR